MVARLAALLDDRDRRPRVDRGRVEDRLEVRLVDVVRARAGDEAPARVQELQRAEVDLLVPAGRLRTRPCSWRRRAGRGSRCRSARRAVEVVQESKTLASRVVTLPSPLSAALAFTRASASSETSTATTSVAPAPPGTEAAVVGEGVEDAAPGVAGGHQVVLALVEEEPGLLAVPEVDLSARAALSHLDRLRDLAVEHADLLLQALQLAHPRVVALQDALRLSVPPGRTISDFSRSVAWESVCTPGTRRSGRPPATARRRLRRAPAGTPPRPGVIISRQASGAPRPRRRNFGQVSPRETMRREISERAE